MAVLLVLALADIGLLVILLHKRLGERLQRRRHRKLWRRVVERGTLPDGGERPR